MNQVSIDLFFLGVLLFLFVFIEERTVPFRFGSIKCGVAETEITGFFFLLGFL